MGANSRRIFNKLFCRGRRRAASQAGAELSRQEYLFLEVFFFNHTRLSGEVLIAHSFLLSLLRTPTTLELRRQVSIISLQPPLQPEESQHSDVCWKIDPPLSGVDGRTFPPQPEEAAGMKSKTVGRGGGKRRGGGGWSGGAISGASKY